MRYFPMMPANSHGEGIVDHPQSPDSAMLRKRSS